MERDADIPESLLGYTLRKADGNLIGFLGEGGFGRTYRAEILSGVSRQVFALKIPKKLKDESRKRVVRELNNLAALEHKNLVCYSSLLNSAEFGFCIAMDLCEGGNLRDLIKRYGKIDEETALLIILQAAEGLQAAHEAGFIHRDIKPENLLIAEKVDSDIEDFRQSLRSGSVTVKVADFGLAVTAEDQVESNARSVSGTPRYSSPEQLKGRSLSASSDLYSLGLTLWELLNGVYPYKGLNEKDLKKRHDPTTPGHIIADEVASHEGRELLGGMLEKDYSLRIQTAREVVDQIQRILGLNSQGGGTPHRDGEPSSLMEEEFLGEAEFGKGRDSDFYRELDHKERLRSRLVGEVREANLISRDGELVALTKWSLAFGGMGSDLEEKLREYLRTLHREVSADSTGTLLKFIDLRRTETSWCVAEEWGDEWEKSPPPNLQNTLSLRKRPFTMEEASVLLQPIAEICDRFFPKGLSLPLNLEEIILDIGGCNLADLIEKPITEWPSLRVRFSALALPDEFVTQINEEIASVAGTLSSSSSGIDASSYDVKRSFCRLLYRVVEGSDVPVEAEWDSSAYIEASRLSGASNLLLKDWISDSSEPPGAIEILGEICKNEGVYRRVTSARDSGIRTSGDSRRNGPGGGSTSRESISNRGYSSGQSTPPSTFYGDAVFTDTYSGATSSSSPHSRNHPVAAVLGPGRVRSPYSGEEQAVPGDRWLPGQPLSCEKTPGSVFVLPEILVHRLEARLVPDRYDQVYTPYRPGDVAVNVPPNQWIPGGDFVCPKTGLEFRLPFDLPFPEALPVDESPGWVRFPKLPGLPGGELPVDPREWESGALVRSESFAMLFRLPAELPPFEAEITDRPGFLRSPYAPDASPFQIDLAQLATGVLLCERTHRELAVPKRLGEVGLPAEVLTSPYLSVRSPFDGVVFPLALSEWQPGGKVIREGRLLILPACLPTISLSPAAIIGPCKVRLPISLGFGGKALEPIRVPADKWLAEQELDLEIEGEEGDGFVTVTVFLPENLGEHSLPEANKRDLDAAFRKVKGPFENSEPFLLESSRWRPGQLLTCPTSGREFRLPEALPKLFGESIAGQPGKVKSPYDPKRTVTVALDSWVDGSEIEDAEATEDYARYFRLPEDLPEWIEPASPVIGRPGWVVSPYGSGVEVNIDPCDWKSGELVTCPRSKRRFSIDLPKDAPSLELETAIVDRALSDPESNEQRLVKLLDESFRGVKSAVVTAVLKRHELDTSEKRRSALPIAEVLVERCGANGWIRPFAGSDPVEVPACEWRPGAKRECSSGKVYRLPERLEPLLGSAPSPGKCRSPYEVNAVEEPVEPSSLWWVEVALQRCSKSGLDFRLPPCAERPYWRPMADIPAPDTLDPGRVPKVRSPHGKRLWQEVNPRDWERGAQLNCAETGAPFVLPDSLPYLPADPKKIEGNTVRSPYVDHGGEVTINDAESWHGGKVIPCPETKRFFVLPEELPDYLFVGLLPVAAGPFGQICSPYATRNPIRVEGKHWRGGERIKCPVTGKYFRLPDAPPPLQAALKKGKGHSVGNGAPCQVMSPYEGAVEISVDVKQWKSGSVVVCPETRLECVLPDDLPEWIVPGVVDEKRPGYVFSPYVEGECILIHPRDWETGRAVSCPASGRKLTLPDALPPMYGRVDPENPGWVESPYDPDCRIRVDYAAWRADSAFTCERTRRPFVLPADLPDWILDAEPIEGKPGTVRSPHGKRTQFEVPGYRWKAGESLECPETGLKLRLPAMIPPLVAANVDGKPGFVISPYANPPKEVEISRRQWRHGELADCPLTKRPLRLPDELPPLPTRRLQPILVMIVVVAAAFIAFAIWPRSETDGTDGFSKSGEQTLSGASAQVATPGTGASGVSKGEPVVKEVPPPLPWPGRVVLLQGVEPPVATVEATLVTSSGAESSGKVEVTKTGLRWIIDLSGILPSDARAITSLSLRFAAPGFESAPLSLAKREEGWEEETFTRNELLSLNRLTSGVTLAGDQNHPCYGSVRFRMIEAPAGLRPAAEPYEFAIDPSKGRTHELPTGIYRVSLLARPGLSHSKGPIEVAERVLHERFEIGGKSGGTSTVEIPAWPLPRSAVGVERTVLAPVKYAFFGRPRDADLGYVPGESTVGVERAIVLDLNKESLEGQLYGEDSIIFDPTPFDTLAGQYAYDIVTALDQDRGRSQRKDGLRDFAPILPYLDILEKSFDSGLEEFNPTDTDQAWSQRRARVESIAGLGRRIDVHFIDTDAPYLTSEFYATPKSLEQFKSSKNEASYPPLCKALWLKCLHSSSSGPEYENISREESVALLSQRSQHERLIGLPAANEREALFQAWLRVVRAVFGKLVAPSRGDLIRLTKEFRVGGYEGALMNVSAFRVSRVESDGSIKFEIDLKDDATRAVETKKDLTIDILDTGQFRLKLPRTSDSELVLYPANLVD